VIRHCVVHARPHFVRFGTHLLLPGARSEYGARSECLVPPAECLYTTAMVMMIVLRRNPLEGGTSGPYRAAMVTSLTNGCQAQPTDAAPPDSAEAGIAEWSGGHSVTCGAAPSPRCRNAGSQAAARVVFGRDDGGG